jgi:glutamyl-Q tRNA(Asp) synthetase
MEDLDAARVVPGSASDILRCLESLGLWWDGEVEYQSRRTDLYARALEALGAAGLTFECSCSRSDLETGGGGGGGGGGGEFPGAYPGTCRGGPTRGGPTALRFRVDDAALIRFEDRLQGGCEYPLRQLGDVVIRRRDGVAAYQLAVVVDDDAQGITSVVRGADLLPSTAWQIALSRALELPAVTYAHLPIVVEPDGSKLAKSRRSVPIDPAHAAEWLSTALSLLRQNPPAELAREPPGPLIAWAIAHWSVGPVSRLRTICATPR